jgi:hypothetical protein
MLLCFLFFTFSIISIWLRKVLKRKSSTKLILRRSILFSALIVGMLIFSSLDVLNFMSALTYIFAIVLLEFFFSSKKLEKERL